MTAPDRAAEVAHMLAHAMPPAGDWAAFESYQGLIAEKLRAYAAEAVLEERRVIYAAEEATRLTGHDPACQFAGCTCGAVEAFKIARAEFYRCLREARSKAATIRARTT